MIPWDEMNYVDLLIGYLKNGRWDFAEGCEDMVETKLIESDGRFLQ